MNTTVADLLYAHNLNSALLPIETRIQNYQNDFLSALKLSEQAIFNAANPNNGPYDKVVNNFDITSITQNSDAANIYGSAQNDISNTTLQTGTRSYTAYTYTPAATPQVQYQTVSLAAAALLYDGGGGFIELPYGAQPIVVMDPWPTSGGGSSQQPSHIVGYSVPTSSNTISTSYNMTAYTATAPVYTTYNNQQLVVEIINGGSSSNNIQSNNGGYANLERWWGYQSDVVYSFDGVRLRHIDTYHNDLDIAHQVLNGGAGDDVLSGGGWALDANGYDSFYAGGDHFFQNMGNRSGSFCTETVVMTH